MQKIPRNRTSETSSDVDINSEEWVCVSYPLYQKTHESGLSQFHWNKENVEWKSCWSMKGYGFSKYIVELKKFPGVYWVTEGLSTTVKGTEKNFPDLQSAITYYLLCS